MNQLSRGELVGVISALTEGVSIRATGRLVDVHQETVRRWAGIVGDGCAQLHDALVRNVFAGTVQLDELWTFVGKKQKRLKEGDPPEYGDTYVFIALDPRTKLVIAYLADKRSVDAARRFVADVRNRVLGRPLVVSDGFSPYRDAVESAFGSGVRYGMVVKEYEHTGRRDAKREGRYVTSHRTAVVGAVAPSEITTSLVERWNLTMRMGQRRFTRRSNGFSKRLPALRSAVALQIAYYNFCRVHETIRVTPAMEAGLTTEPWSVDQLIDAAVRRPENDGPTPVSPIVAPNPLPTFGGLRLIRGGAR